MAQQSRAELEAVQADNTRMKVGCSGYVMITLTSSTGVTGCAEHSTRSHHDLRGGPEGGHNTYSKDATDCIG